ncbi:MAG: squalene/phytoene synthase family protein [Alphaproteobacteria bacterium]|nr:squalene/phytoene synthase family protein [Alphaproteobacteria bacterium]
MSFKLSYCGQQVRAHDLDRFFLSMFAPPQCREALWALFAFNYEIAKTREVVSETQLGLIRLQWWRDAIAVVYESGDIPEHEVVQPLAAAIAAYDLPREPFDKLIYAREFDLEDVRPTTLEGLLNYADFTTTPLMSLAVRICGGEPDAEPVHPIALNYALSGLLRSVPTHAQQRRCFLPEDLMNEHGMYLNQLYDGKPQAGMPKVVEALTDKIVPGVRAETPFLKAAQALSMVYKRQIKGLGYDVFNPKMRLQPAFKALRVLMAVKTS